MKNKIEMKKWLLYSFAVTFTFYCAGNIILWFPWSINANLVIAMMLSVMPLFWAFGMYLCLIRYNGENLLTGCALTALIMVVGSVILDFLFFGLIREAWNDLYKLTTFYGYGFLAVLPFIEFFLFKKMILRKNRNILAKDFIPLGIVSLVSIIIQTIILINL